MKRFILPALLFLSLPAAADIPPALLEKAEGGDTSAQLDVATRFMAGDGVDRDELQALDWLKKSAEGGNREALFSLGMLYADNKVFPADDAESFKWYKLAADKGDGYAAYAVSEMYRAGKGAAKDDAKAEEYLKKAAEGGHPDAQVKTGAEYLKKEDYENAWFWLAFPSEGGAFPGQAQELRDKAAAKLSPEKIAELKTRTENWVAPDYAETKAKADKGDAAAQTALGVLHLSGTGALKSAALAESWFNKAADQGDAEAQFQLAQLLTAHNRWDYAKAAPLLEKAAASGHAGAMALLGDFYAEGSGVPANAAEAAKWYKAAGEKGIARAQSKLGEMYFDGMGVARDMQESVFWLSLAAAHGDDSLKDLREQAAQDLTPPQKDAVKQRLREWKRK